jgi:hypothetical protein
LEASGEALVDAARAKRAEADFIVEVWFRERMKLGIE